MVDKSVTKWAASQLFDVVGFSDKLTAEFCVAAAGSAKSPDDLISVLSSQGTLKDTPYILGFSFNLQGSKAIPHRFMGQVP